MAEKLVRDRVPALVEAETGIAPKVRRASGEDLLLLLREKLREELAEVLGAADAEGQLAELADLQEVLDAYVRALGSHPYRLGKLRWDKQARKGAFTQGLVMEIA